MLPCQPVPRDFYRLIQQLGAEKFSIYPGVLGSKVQVRYFLLVFTFTQPTLVLFIGVYFS